MIEQEKPATAPITWRRVVRWIVAGSVCLFGLLVLALILNPRAPRRPIEPKVERGEVRFLHGMDVTARRADEPRVTDNTRRVSIEVYRDDQTGNVVYISRPDITRKGSTVSVVRGATD